MLWEVDIVCKRYGILPSSLLGLDRLFSDAVCFDIDVTIAKFGLQTESRQQEQVKRASGKGYKNKYSSMAEVLGIDQEEWRGGFDSQEQLVDYSKLYLAAVRQAVKRGESLPPIDEWIAQQEAAEEDDDLDG